MALKSVLIVTAGFGEGHNAAARNLAEAVRLDCPQAHVEVHDVFLEAYGWANRLIQKGYLLVINHAPWIWKAVFRWLDGSNAVGGGIGIFRRAARRLSALIAEMDPDVVVSTYPGYGHLLDHIYRGAAFRPFRKVTVVTDSLTINSVWHRCHSDFFLVPNQATADVMQKAGVPSAKIRVTGFPVPAVFAGPPPSRDCPPSDGQWRVLFMVNSAHHTAPDVVRELLGIEKISLTVTVGRDARLASRLEELAKSLGRPLEIHGWTPEIPNLIRRSHLLVSKAGGATVQESLAARTPMVITQIVPGQEEGNARLLIESGAGELATTPTAIAEAVRKTFANGAALYHSRFDATLPLSHPRSSAEAARFLASLA